MSPSTRDWRLYADDIIESCGNIRRFIAGMTFEAEGHIRGCPFRWTVPEYPSMGIRPAPPLQCVA